MDPWSQNWHLVWQFLSVFLIVIPFPAKRLTALQQYALLDPHAPIKGLHDGLFATRKVVVQRRHREIEVFAIDPIDPDQLSMLVAGQLSVQTVLIRLLVGQPGDPSKTNDVVEQAVQG